MDYEDLPEGATTAHHMVAGTCAGIMEHCITYPLDIIKTRAQCLRPAAIVENPGLLKELKNLIFYEGFRQSFRGVDVVILGAGPAHALYFGIYEYVKSHLQSRTHPSSIYSHFVHAISGTCATLAHDAIMTPADAIKQRMQVVSDPRSTSLQCLRTVLGTTGVATLYRAYFTQLALNVPFQCVHFVTYEFFQLKLNPDREYKPWTHIISGGIAGGAAAAITTPMDVCKTVLNTQDCVNEKLPVSVVSTNTTTASAPAVVAADMSAVNPSVVPKATVVPNSGIEKAAKSSAVSGDIRGLFGAAQAVLEKQGPLGLFRGMKARVVGILPSTAISWSIYEYFKWMLSRRSAAVSDKRESNPSTWS